MLITGGTGLLGEVLTRYFSDKYMVFSVGRRDFDIRNSEQVFEYFKKIKPGLVLHAAAYTNVDQCETEKEFAMAVNAVGTANVASACNESKAKMIYYSTDYVFDGRKENPYIESDKTNPLNFYGVTKLEGEKQVASLLDDHAIMRVSWIYSHTQKSFILSWIEAARKQNKSRMNRKLFQPIDAVSDQIGCPTWAEEIARQTEVIIDNGVRGMFHCSSDGETSRYHLALLLFDLLSINARIEKHSMKDFPNRALRPRYSALENARLKKFNLNIMKDYQEALKEFLKKHICKNSRLNANLME